jgi:hypothetical protein
LNGFSKDKFRELIEIIPANACLNLYKGSVAHVAFSKKYGAILKVFAME